MKRNAPTTTDLRETATRKIAKMWSPSRLLLSIGMKALATLTRLGIAPKEDPWRKRTRAFHRGEEGKIVLAVFRLNPYSDFPTAEGLSGFLESEQFCEHIVNRLALFLRIQRELLRHRLDWRRSGVRIVDNAHVDVVMAAFDDEGRLSGITADLESPTPRPQDAAKLDHDVVDSYNQTKDLDDKRRPYIFARMLRAAAVRGRRHRQEELAYTERVASGVFIHFEVADPKDRFQLPDFSRRKHPGQGAFNILCQFTPDRPRWTCGFRPATS